jgi:hypothetical protein
MQNIANMLYFSQMAIFYQPKPEQPRPPACTLKYSLAPCCDARHAASASHFRCCEINNGQLAKTKLRRTTGQAAQNPAAMKKPRHVATAGFTV